MMWTSSAKKWVFHLNGNFHDLMGLSNGFGTPRMHIYGGVNEWLDCPNDDFRMTSIYCHEEDDPNLVWQIGYELVDLFNGASALFGSHAQPLSIESLWLADDQMDFVEQSGNVGLLNQPTSQDFDPDREQDRLQKGDKRFLLLKLATENEDAYHILKYLSRPLDWVNLYRLLETIESWAKNNSLELETDKKARDQFTNTANNFSLSSFDSRHGFKTVVKANKTPSMTIPEATQFVVKVARDYLNKAYFRKS